MYKGFTFIDMVSQEALALLQSILKVETLRENYEGFTKKDAGKTTTAHKLQASNSW